MGPAGGIVNSMISMYYTSLLFRITYRIAGQDGSSEHELEFSGHNESMQSSIATSQVDAAYSLLGVYMRMCVYTTHTHTHTHTNTHTHKHTHTLPQHTHSLLSRSLSPFSLIRRQ